MPAQGSGETTTSQRPHPGNRRKEELHQDLGLGLSFPARRRLLLLWVCSGKVVPGFWGRAGVVASLLHKHDTHGAEHGTCAPPRILKTPSPLVDSVSFQFSFFPLPHPAGTGFSAVSKPQSRL